MDIITGYDRVESVTLTNVGDGYLKIDSTKASGEPFWLFRGSTLDGEYAPGESTRLDIQFAPSELGFQTGTVTFQAPETWTIYLSGTGVKQ